MNSLKINTAKLVYTAASLFVAMSSSTFAAKYKVKEIPAPRQIIVPSGLADRKICQSLNDSGQVACTFEIIENLSQKDLARGRMPKVFSSYAFVWNSTAITSSTNPRILSPLNANTLDRANVINNRGWVGGQVSSSNLRNQQAALWLSGSTPVSKGFGAITDLDGNGDYINNGKLFIREKVVTFPGTNVQVHVINPLVKPTTGVKPAGQQVLSSALGQSGIGLLYSKKPTTGLPWYALSGIRNGFRVRDMTDNGNFVISGAPTLTESNIALNCTGVTRCQLYTPTVGPATTGKSNRWITLNGVNKKRFAVGTDGGIGIRIDPPSARYPKGREINLNLEPGIVRTGLTISEGTAINTRGQIVVYGLLGSSRSTFLLTPV